MQRLLGTEAEVVGRGKMVIADGDAKSIVVERLQSRGLTYEHSSRRPAVFRHILGWCYVAGVEKPGDVFVEDVVGAPVVFRHQKVWARQLDIEGAIEDNEEIDAKLVNDGGRVWILGFNTEDDGTHILTRNGGQTELLGGLHVGDSTKGPRFITEDAQFSAAVVNGGTDRVRERRRGETRRGNIGHADLYTAFGPEAVQPIYVDNEDRDRVEIRGNWEAVTAAPGGFSEHNLLLAKPGSQGSVTFRASVEQAGRYEVSLRWIAQISSPIRYAESVPVEIVHARGMKALTANQRVGGGEWHPLGVFEYSPKSMAKVVVRAQGAQGTVQADAIRLVKSP